VRRSLGHAASSERRAPAALFAGNPTTRSFPHETQWTRRNARDRTPHSRNARSLKSLKRKHTHEFTAKLLTDVEPATVNRSLAVLKNMLGFAVDKEYLAANPLARFKLLPEEQKPTRILNLEEYWRLIECHNDPVAAPYATVLGETAIRKSEGIRLTWSFIDVHQRLLTVERSKNRKPRYIPLSEFALQALACLPRLDGCPSVFVRLEKGTRWRSFQGPFQSSQREGRVGMGRVSGRAPVPGKPVGDARGGHSHRSRAPRAPVDNHHDAVRAFRASARNLEHPGSAEARSRMLRFGTGEKQGARFRR
jgi:Phage integrase family